MDADPFSEMSMMFSFFAIFGTKTHKYENPDVCFTGVELQRLSLRVGQVTTDTNLADEEHLQVCDLCRRKVAVDQMRVWNQLLDTMKKSPPTKSRAKHAEKAPL